MAIVKRFTGGDSHEKSAMLVKGSFDAVALGETFEIDGNLFSECPILIPVFGDLENPNSFRNNDFLGIFDNVNNPFIGLTIELLDEDCNVLAELNDDTYGTYYPAGSFSNNIKNVGYRLEWKNVLAIHGPGVYKIKKTLQNSLIFFGDREICSCNFNLMHYTDEDADNTVKMVFQYDSYYINSNEDFRGENWTSMFRVHGYFGNPKPQLERSSYLNTSRQITDIQDKAFNEYTFETEHVPYCISELLIPTQENKSLASIADTVFITDYNLTNHFKYNSLPVLITKIKVNDNSSSKKVNYEITCEDRNRKNVKRKVR